MAKKTTKPEAVTTGKVDAVKVEPKVEAPKTTTTLADKLAGLSKGKTKAKTPVLDLVEPVPGIVAKAVRLHKEYQEKKAEYEALQAELIEAAGPKYREYLAKVQFVNTALVTNGTENVSLTWKDAYSSIPLAVRSEIEAVVGEAKFKDFFATTASINLTTADEAVINKVVDLLEKAGLLGQFEVEGFIKPNTRFTTERFKVFTSDQNTQLDPLVKQYKPSLRVR